MGFLFNEEGLRDAFEYFSKLKMNETEALINMKLSHAYFLADLYTTLDCELEKLKEEVDFYWKKIVHF